MPSRMDESQLMSEQVFTQRLAECCEPMLVGGKAANLGRLLRAGFPVPDGFVITTCARDCTHGELFTSPASESVSLQVLAAYHRMGRGMVAVRSSATLEDTANGSMAGQFDSVLNVKDERELLDAVAACWDSINSPRVRAYLREQGKDLTDTSIAVVVQRQISAEVSGVLFTVNPNAEIDLDEMCIEATRGLGDKLVSGEVPPDVFRLDRKTGRLLDATAAEQTTDTHDASNPHEPIRSEPATGVVGRTSERVDCASPCLSDRQLYQLWRLGIQVEQHFGFPQDIEWAIHGDAIHLLQARPITTYPRLQVRCKIIRETQVELRHQLSCGRGPWVLHNLSETLPHPTPLTWSVMKSFMSGSGGFGAMYRLAGFAPSRTVQRDGMLDLIAGRIYMDLSRAPEMFFENFPFAYDTELMKRSPGASQLAPTLVRGSLWERTKASRRLRIAQTRLLNLSNDWDVKLREQVFPAVQECSAKLRHINLCDLSHAELIALWQSYEDQVMNVFGAQLLLPSLISSMALQDLHNFLAEHFWEEDPEALSQFISSGGPPDSSFVSNAELFEVAQGSRRLEDWIAAHGHRGSGEFELAAPRWRELSTALSEQIEHFKNSESPVIRHNRHQQEVKDTLARLSSQLNQRTRKELVDQVGIVWRYIQFREDSKDVLMRGYGGLRELACEAGRRLSLSDDVFYLTREEVFESLRGSFPPLGVIEQRRDYYAIESQLVFPHFIDADSIDRLGRMPEIERHAAGYNALPISGGQAIGTARILKSPDDVPALPRGHILVCPSTDPSWTSLFADAAGLIVECGGALSHGAVVAREMGLPAVVLPYATRLLSDGETIRIDGSQGWVDRVAEDTDTMNRIPISDSNNTRVDAKRTPPPAGRSERFSGRCRNVGAAVWAAYLLAFFLLPSHLLFWPTMHAFDALLWPLVRAAGRPAAVAIVAAAIATLTLLAQRFLTDNRRLIEAKRRAAGLKQQASALPKTSARRAALLTLAAPVQARLLSASLVPIGLLIGPMVMSFIWLKQRVDPAVWSPAPGSSVQITAKVDGEWPGTVRLEAPTVGRLDEATPATYAAPPIRTTLERLHALYDQPATTAASSPELAFVSDLTREQLKNNLGAFLSRSMPAQGVTWLLHTPSGFNGRLKVHIVAGNSDSPVEVVIGNQYPPAPARDIRVSPPLREVTLSSPKARDISEFWKPFKILASTHSGLMRRISNIHVSWIMLYVMIYVVVFMVGRGILKIA